jgi:hypothetical protein
LYLEATGEVLNRDALFAHRVLREWETAAFGAGRRLAVLENDAIEDNLFMNVSGYFRPGVPIYASHAHAVAGGIGSRLFTRLGTAPLAMLFSANTGSLDDGDITAGVDWVIENRIDVTNLSWGGLEYDGEIKYRDRLMDYHSRYTLQSIVAAAGNGFRVDGMPAYVASPALAWNVIAVGNIQTGPPQSEDPPVDPNPADWSNDRMAPNSSSANPRNRNQKPNVAARGTNIKIPGERVFGYIYPLDSQSGTSNAAPYVTATLALAMNRNPTLLPAPETAMATVMATAWNNVDGPDDRPISNRDGAGGIHTSAAVSVAAANRTWYRIITPTTLNSRGFYAIPIQLEAGNRTRIAVSWSAAALSLAHSLQWLQTDFDLVIYEGRDDELVCCSAVSLSAFNNTELVDFVPRQTGWYTIAVFAPRLGREPERVGFAISHYDDDVAE